MFKFVTGNIIAMVAVIVLNDYGYTEVAYFGMGVIFANYFWCVKIFGWLD